MIQSVVISTDPMIGGMLFQHWDTFVGGSIMLNREVKSSNLVYTFNLVLYIYQIYPLQR